MLTIWAITSLASWQLLYFWPIWVVGPWGALLLVRSLPAQPDAVATLQDADAIYLEEIRKAGLYDDIWQAFAVLLPVKTVGVMGDARDASAEHGHTIVARVVEAAGAVLKQLRENRKHG